MIDLRSGSMLVNHISIHARFLDLSKQGIHWSIDTLYVMVISQCTRQPFLSQRHIPQENRQNQSGLSMQIIAVSRRGSPAHHSPFTNHVLPTHRMFEFFGRKSLEISDFQKSRKPNQPTRRHPTSRNQEFLVWMNCKTPIILLGCSFSLVI